MSTQSELIAQLEAENERLSALAAAAGVDPQYIPLFERMSTDKWKARFFHLVESWRELTPFYYRAVKFYNENQSPPGELDWLEKKLEKLQ